MSDRHEVDGTELQRLRLVDAGEFEQVGNEFAHADRLLLDTSHSLGHLLWLLQRAHAIKLRIAAHRDQRCAQLVARIADEPAHLVDGAGAIREGAVDAVEHGVERTIEAPNLGVRGGTLQTLAEVAIRDRGRGGLDLAQRREGGCHEQPRERGTEHDHRKAKPEEDHEELVDQPVGTHEVDGHHHGDVIGRVDDVTGNGHDAPLVVVLLIPDGEGHTTGLDHRA